MVATDRGDVVIEDCSPLPKPGGGLREFITVHRRVMDAAGLKLDNKGAVTATGIDAVVCAGAINVYQRDPRPQLPMYVVQ